MAFQKKRPAQPLTADEALVKLESFCAYRERCPKEVRSRLAELGVRGEMADQIFEVLREDGFFNEERFAVAFAGGKFRMNHWGRVRIRMELRMRDIAPDILQHALDSIDEAEYLATLHLLVEKKRAHYADADNPREKTIAALLRSGFEQDLVFKVV